MRRFIWGCSRNNCCDPVAAYGWTWAPWTWALSKSTAFFIFECMRACPNLVAGPVYTQNKVLAAATAVNSTAATAAPP